MGVRSVSRERGDEGDVVIPDDLEEPFNGQNQYRDAIDASGDRTGSREGIVELAGLNSLRSFL